MDIASNSIVNAVRSQLGMCGKTVDKNLIDGKKIRFQIHVFKLVHNIFHLGMQLCKQFIICHVNLIWDAQIYRFYVKSTTESGKICQLECMNPPLSIRGGTLPNLNVLYYSI